MPPWTAYPPMAGVYFVVPLMKDPDCLAACQARLRHFQPRFGGRFEEATELGRAALRAGNLEGRLPTLLLDAHELVAAERGSKRPERYYERPEVWADIEAACESTLAVYPGDRRLWQRYGRLAALTGRPDRPHRTRPPRPRSRRPPPLPGPLRQPRGLRAPVGQPEPLTANPRQREPARQPQGPGGAGTRPFSPRATKAARRLRAGSWTGSSSRHWS